MCCLVALPEHLIPWPADATCIELLPADSLTVIAATLLGNASSEQVVDDGLALFQFAFSRRLCPPSLFSL